MSAALVLAVAFGLYALAGTSFIGVVINISDDRLTVTMDKDEFYTYLSDKIKVRCDSADRYKTGDILFIVAGGAIEDSYPARVKGDFILRLGNINDGMSEFVD